MTKTLAKWNERGAEPLESVDTLEGLQRICAELEEAACVRCGGSGATLADALKGHDCCDCGGEGRYWLAPDGSGAVWTEDGALRYI